MAVLLLVLAVGLLLLVPDGVLVGCERDGHFQRAGQLSCGLLSPNVPYGPLLPALVAPLVPIVGSAYLASRGFSLLILLGLVALSWRAARDLGAGSRLSGLAALAVGLNGSSLYYGSAACSDLPAAAFFLLAGWAGWRAVVGRGSAPTAFLAGLALACACLVRVQYYLAAPVLLAALVMLTPRARRKGVGSVATLAFAGAVALAAALGWQRWGGLQPVLDMHLGLAAYTRNLDRAGAILESAGVGDGVGLGARLGWSLRLVLRITLGLPLLGGAAALLIALRQPRHRAWLVLLLPALVLWVGLAWSHPPPDWGARRFYLFLIPLCVVPSLLSGRALLLRWFRGVRWAPWLGAVLVLLGTGAHALWELRSFRAPQLGTLLELDPRAPRGLAKAQERAAMVQAGALVSGLDSCAVVATNYHPAATLVRNAWFVGNVSLDGPRGWVDGLTVEPGEPAWLLWVPPPHEGEPGLLRIGRGVDGAPLLVGMP
jgi:hypothetical protein